MTDQCGSWGGAVCWVPETGTFITYLKNIARVNKKQFAFYYHCAQKILNDIHDKYSFLLEQTAQPHSAS